MKVLIVSDRFYPEDFLINELALHWKQKGIDVGVLTQNPSYPESRIYKGYRNKLFQVTRYQDIRIYRFLTITGYKNNLVLKFLNYLVFSFIGTIILFCIARRYDTIFVYQTGTLTQAIPAALLKIFCPGKKVMIWTQDLWPEGLYGWGIKKNRINRFTINRIVSFVYNRMDQILVTSSGFIDRIKRYIKASKREHIPFLTIHNWPPQGLTVKPEKINLPGKFNFLFTGNISIAQNLENIISAFAHIEDSYPDAWLNIVGDGSRMEEITKLSGELRVKQIRFFGRRPQQEMSSFFHSCDVMLLSLFESEVGKLTIPAKFSAYLTAKKPIFGIIKGEVRRIITENDLGYCVDPDDIKAIEDGFIYFLNIHEKDIAILSEGAEKLLNSEFSREKSMQKITDFIVK